MAFCLLTPVPLYAGQEAAPNPTAAGLTLDQAVSAALATNPVEQAAVQQLAQAQARLGQAQAGQRLQITFNSSVSGSNASVLQPPPAHETFGTLQNTVTVPLPIGRRLGLAVTQAQRQFDAARYQYQSARTGLAGQVTGAFYDLLRKQALRDAAQEALTLAQRGLSDTQKRNRAGDAAQLDVLQAQVPVSSAKASLAQAESAVAVARQTLNDLMGRSLDAALTLADVTTPPAAPSETLEQARALALQHSPDVLAADAGVQANKAAVEAARLYREPTFSLQAIDTRSNDQTSFSREDTLQAQVSLPLSDGGLGRAQTQEAQAALAQAQAQAETARRAAILAVSSAYLTAQGSAAQIMAAQEARDIAQTTYEKTVLGYQNGLFPFVNVLNAQNALAQAHIAYVQALYDAASATAALQAAENGGTTGVTPSVPSPINGGATPGNPTPAGTNANGTGTPGPNTNGKKMP